MGTTRAVNPKLLVKEGADPFGATMIALAAAIEARSLHREDHLWRVAEFSTRLAAALGLEEDAMQVIRLAALFHDIGMIGVPDDILRKPRILTPREFEQVARHTVLGAELLSSLPHGEEVAAIVRGHHERWDGAGYPDSLAGTEIPLGARIVAVADAFDALTTDRPHRPAVTPAEGLEILWFGATGQWDPELVELFDPMVKAALENGLKHNLRDRVARYMVMGGFRGSQSWAG